MPDVQTFTAYTAEDTAFYFKIIFFFRNTARVWLYKVVYPFTGEILEINM